jgi:hypothetical protein
MEHDWAVPRWNVGRPPQIWSVYLFFFLRSRADGAWNTSWS